MGVKFKELRKWFTARKWKSIFGAIMYCAVSILVLHDVFIIIAHTISPEFMEWAAPYMLDKLLAALFASFNI